MSGPTGSAIAGAGLAIAGVGMGVAAVRAYLDTVPRSPWILYVYVPIASLLFVVGAVVLVRAQRKYEIEKGPRT